MKETAKVLVFIASSEYMDQNLSEAIKYYTHALVVLNQLVIKNEAEEVLKWIELGKVHVSLA